jgi:hypothetical protein
MREIHRWANDNGYLGGYPTFDQFGNRYEAVLIKEDAPGVEWKDVPRDELHDDAGVSNVLRFKRINYWTDPDTTDYIGGFPNFEQSTTAFGAIIFKKNSPLIKLERNFPLDLLTSFQIYLC